MNEKTQLNVVIPVKQKEILSIFAQSYSLSVNQIINQLIRDYIQTENEKLIMQLYKAGKLVLTEKNDGN